MNTYLNHVYPDSCIYFCKVEG